MPRHVGIVATLALIEGVLGAAAVTIWLVGGMGLLAGGRFLGALIGILAVGKGAVAAIPAALFLVFAWGALSLRAWAWGVGLVAAGVTLIVVLGLLPGAEAPIRALAWAVIPLGVLVYLLTPTGRQAFRR